MILQDLFKHNSFVKRGIFLLVEYIKEHKEAKRLKVKDLAEMTNIPESTINNFFSRKTENPSFDIVSKLCIAVGGSLDEMVGLKEAVEKNKEPGLKEFIENLTDSFKSQIETYKTQIEVYKSQIEDYKKDKETSTKDKKWLYVIILALISFEFILGMF